MSTVLVVDDDPDIRTLIAWDLSQDGHEVHTARDGEEALESILRVRPDVVLLDWMMPKLNGLELCRLVRSARDGVGVPVIFVTAKTQRADLIEGFMAGADDYLTKPFTAEQLTERVRRALEAV